MAIQHGKFPQPSFAGCLVLPTVGSAVPAGPRTSVQDCAGIYTDAMYEAGKPAGMAFVAQRASRAYPKVGYLAVPDSIMQVLLPRKTQINQAECLAVSPGGPRLWRRVAL